MDTGEKRRRLGLSIRPFRCRAYQRRLSAGGDLANESGEKDFDGSIREALRISLAQSPLLNLLSEKNKNASKELAITLSNNSRLWD
jgi:hypothetical protein